MSSVGSVDSNRLAALSELADRLDHRFHSALALDLALRHRSWCSEHGGIASNERLEFLGDAVLQMVMTDHLYLDDPDAPEGLLAQRRAALVNTRVLANAARSIELGPMVRLGRGEAATGGADKDSILADATEAIIGSVYLDAGMDAAAHVVRRLLTIPLAALAAGADPGDPKSRLQETAARALDLVPRYALSDDGPDHAKEFTAEVFLGSDRYGHGRGRTKKDAEQAAAAQALAALADSSQHRAPDHRGSTTQ